MTQAARQITRRHVPASGFRRRGERQQHGSLGRRGTFPPLLFQSNPKTYCSGSPTSTIVQAPCPARVSASVLHPPENDTPAHPPPKHHNSKPGRKPSGPTTCSTPDPAGSRRPPSVQLQTRPEAFRRDLQCRRTPRTLVPGNQKHLLPTWHFYKMQHTYKTHIQRGP